MKCAAGWRRLRLEIAVRGLTPTAKTNVAPRARDGCRCNSIGAQGNKEIELIA